MNLLSLRDLVFRLRPQACFPIVTATNLELNLGDSMNIMFMNK